MYVPTIEAVYLITIVLQHNYTMNINLFDRRLCKYREQQLHCFLRSLRRRRMTMNSEEMHHQVQFKAREQLRKWDERFKKVEQRHTRGLKRGRRQLYTYDAFELAGGPSSPAETLLEEVPSSPSSRTSGSQVGSVAQDELHEVREPSKDKLNSTSRGDHDDDEQYEETCEIVQY